MPIDFFEPTVRASTDAELFGLCDDETLPGQVPAPAYLDIQNPFAWIGEVENPSKMTVDFYPVDNHLAIFREDGSIENKCDCLLHYNNSVHFIELKERQFSGWVSSACRQLKATINCFSQNYNISEYNLKAQICNKARPNFSQNYMISMEKFEDETNVGLIIAKLVRL